MVRAVIQIEQFSVDSAIGSIRNKSMLVSDTNTIRNTPFSSTAVYTFTHLYPVSNPVASAREGWETEDEEQWSDSPTFQPYFLYRQRFSWGRDKKELTTISGLNLYDDGARWGNLDNASGLLFYNREFSVSSSTTIRQISRSASTTIRNKDLTISRTSELIHQMGPITGDVIVEQFPYVIQAVPEPFSIKNSVDTNVFIRVANFANPIASGTINLFINDVARSINITEFFSGNGGFDILWTNDETFNYDAQVNVRLEFRDIDTPPNITIIRYPFYTVVDLAHPRIINKVPSDNAIGVSVNNTIQFDAVDFESGVDITTLRLFVNGTKAIDGINGDLDLIEIDDGYTIRYTSYEPWNYGDLIAVAVFLNDTSEHANELFDNYSFITTESITPVIIDPIPDSCQIGVSVDTNIQVDVIDGGHGIDKDTVKLEVDEIEKTNILKIPIIHRED